MIVLHSHGLATPTPAHYSLETNPFDLTPEQKGLLVSLAQETGKPIPALLAEALEELEEHLHARPGALAVSGNGDQTRPPADIE